MDIRIGKLLALLLCLRQFVTSFDSCALKQHKITVAFLQIASKCNYNRCQHPSTQRKGISPQINPCPTYSQTSLPLPTRLPPRLICSCSWNSVVAKAANRAVGKKTMISGCSARVGPKNKPKQLTAPAHLVRCWPLLDLLVQYIPARDGSMKLVVFQGAGLTIMILIYHNHSCSIFPFGHDHQHLPHPPCPLDPSDISTLDQP